MRGALLCAVGLCLLGCEERPPLPPIVFEGEHIRYRTHEQEERVCTGTFEALERKAGQLKEVFGSDAIVDYSWIPDDRYFDFCPTPQGCSIGTEAFSEDPINEHELVHGVRPRSAYLPLEEGLAVFFGDDFSLEEGPDDLIETLLDDQLPADYGKWGRFVSYLDAEFGTEALVSLADASPRSSSGSDFEAAVEETMGVSLRALVEDFEERYPLCQVVEFRHESPYCDQPGLELTGGYVGETVEANFEIACDDGHTQGARDGKQWRYETFVVPEDTIYHLTITPSSPSGESGLVVLSPCQTSCFDDTRWFQSESFVDEALCLPKGTYLLRLAIPKGGSVRFSATPTGFTC